ncbi:pentapeptide repeat-containing protein [Saccharopolyspora gloriosae]|uniref:Uncharacterized protein YjbI with pentapeptide repeats n=1 Tax=Saccharopolyspora gloriosae TaxID=455344 RepID=A0A840N4V5_9PSEU|nr:uncharacterized protein YjbI with pentapeptide repeats [Saccharopolyspora gloriosae]
MTDDEPEHVPVMPAWSIWAGAAVLLVVGTLAVWLLLSLYGGGSAQDKIQLEIIKLAGSIVVGTGGAVALFLAARRQRTTELDLAQKARTAVATEHDATERRVTELYAAAAEQLGSDKAPVRMAGLYALERLGQANPIHRQTIVDLMCSYLRMPFSPSNFERDTSPIENLEEKRKREIRPRVSIFELDGQYFETESPGLAAFVSRQPKPELAIQDEEAIQEIQVRQTVQRLIGSHIRPSRQDKDSGNQFWEDIDLDLSEATLFQWSMDQCCVRSAQFRETRFVGGTYFVGSRFKGEASFDESRFFGGVTFKGASFEGELWSTGTVFDGVNFSSVEFFDGANFGDATFNEMAIFRSASFHGDASFRNAYFGEGAKFAHVDFYKDASFDQAQFLDAKAAHPSEIPREAWFGSCRFHSLAHFHDSYAFARTTGEVWSSIPNWEAQLVDNEIEDNYERVLMAMIPRGVEN